LRYEYDTYVQLQKDLPPIGAEVVTNVGRARILGHEVLTQQLLVHLEDNRRMLIDAAEVVSVLKKKSQKSGQGNSDSDDKRNSNT